MKIVIGFISGCVFGLVATAFAVETSDLGRYQSSTTAIGDWVYVTTIDTTTGELVSAEKIKWNKYKKINKVK